MTNMTKDYYKILDISEFSTQDEIKCAYRKLARKWHPDVAGNCSDAISKFKEINEAYEILSNKIRKEEYDRARKFYNYSSKNQTEMNKETATNPNTNEQKYKKQQNKTKNSFSFNWEEFIAKKRSYEQFNTKNKENKIPQKGNDISTDIEISIEEAINGTTKIINMLQTTICPKCGGRKFVNGSICNNCGGKGEISEYKKFSVKIPAGIKNNSKIRLSGEGENGFNGGKSGDLYITVFVKKINQDKTEGINIIKTVQINDYDAVLGTNIKVETNNGNVTVKIPPNTQNKQKIRLAGCGICQGNKIGDMIIIVEIILSSTYSDEEISLYKRLKEIHEQAGNKS